MPNGRPGDHPVTDLMVWGTPQFDDELDAVIREFETLRPKYEMDERGDPMWDQPPLAKLIFAAKVDPDAREKLRAAPIGAVARISCARDTDPRCCPRRTEPPTPAAPRSSDTAGVTARTER